MAKILEKYINLMPRLQARKIEDELRKNISLARDPASFRAAYQEELRALLASDTDIRTQALELLADSSRDSEVVNWMIRSIASDLSALSSEADTLFSLKEMEVSVMRNDVLDKLRRATMEAEAEVERMEIIRGNTSGLRESLVDNFSSSYNRLPRSDQNSHFVFLDPKTGEVADPIFDCVMGNYGLTLPIDISRTVQPTSIREVMSSDVRDPSDRLAVAGSSTPSTSGDAEFTGRILNIIDRRVGTFWSKRLTTEEKPPLGAICNLEVNLGPNVSSVNFVDIQAAIGSGQELIGLYYVDENLFVHTIELEQPVILDQPRRITLPLIQARKITVVIRQKEFLTLSDPIELVQKRVYKFGIDNILIGNAKYLDRGYYVSKTLRGPKITKVVLDASWLPYSGEDQTEVARSQVPPTAEFWVSLRESDSNGVVVYEKMIPILPVGRSSISERVIVTDTNKGKLSFSIEQDIADDDEDLILYRDSSQILRPDDYTISQESEGVEEGSVLDIPQGFNRASEFVAEYVPLFRKFGIVPNVLLDSTGVIQFNSDGSINILRPESSRAVASEINLIIVLRGTGNGTSSPIVNKYILSVG